MNAAKKCVKAVNAINPFKIAKEYDALLDSIANRLEENAKIMAASSKAQKAKAKKAKEEKKKQLELEDEAQATPPATGVRRKAAEGNSNEKTAKKRKQNERRKWVEIVDEESESDSDSDMSYSCESDSEDDAEEPSTKREELQHSIAKLKKVKENLLKGKKLTEQELQLMMVEQMMETKTLAADMMRENAKLAREIRQAKKERDDLKKKVNRLEAAMNRPEIQTAKKGIIIRGLPEAENIQEDVPKVLQILGEKLSLDKGSVEHVRRLQINRTLKDKLEKEGKQIIRPLLMRFCSIAAKFEFMKNLPRMKDWEEGKYIRVSNDIPLCLKSRNNVLEEQARSLRAKSENLRTRVIFADLDLKLQSKMRGEKEWKDIDIEI